MKTIQVTIDEALQAELDVAARALEMSLEAFVYEALLRALHERALSVSQEQRHARGYARRPPAADEFEGWEAEQVWGEP